MGKLLDESGLTTLWNKIKNNFVKKTDLKDYIIEIGTDGNGWTYEKWNSGLLVAWKRHLFDEAATEYIPFSAHPLRYSIRHTKLPSYAAANTDKYLQATYYQHESSVQHMVWIGEVYATYATSGSTNDAINVYVWSVVDNVVTKDMYIDLYFRGRY